MFRWLRKYFIPHPKNDYHPHFLKTPGRMFVLVSVFLLQSFLVISFLIFSRTSLFANIFPDVLVSEANDYREQENLSPLTTNPVLEAAAKKKAEHMAENGYFAHVSPDGKTPWYWLDQVGYKFSYAGENLAVNFFDSKDLARAWMDSPLHRANIMNDKFTEIGIATASGIYNGKEAVFVVQFFGRPSTANTARLPKPPAQVSGSTPQEKFISTGNAEVKSEAITPPAVVPQEKPSVIQKAISSPVNTVNYIQFFLLGLVVLALLLAVFVEIKVQKIAPIMSGFLLIAIIGGVVYVNHLIASIAQIF